MAYQLVAAKARAKGLDGLWSDASVGGLTFDQLFATYRRVWLTLSHPSLTVPAYLDLGLIRETIMGPYHALTVDQWLVLNGDTTLPTVPTSPLFTLKRLRYNDVWRAGYNVKPIDRFRNDDAEIPYGAKNDLLLSKPGVDFREWQRYALVSVNGYFHRSGGTATGLQVIDGGRTGRTGNANHLGMHSFKDVGVIDQLPLTESMLYTQVAGAPMSDHIYVQLPYSVEGRTVLLVIGGYLHVLDDVYDVVGPTTLRININRLALPERYLQSRQTLDLSSLGLTQYTHNEYQVSTTELYSDTVLKRYLTLPQSFVVVLKADNLYVSRTPAINSKFPQRFEAPKGTERLPLFGAYGRLCEYEIFPDWGINVLAADHNTRANYGFRTTDWRTRAALDNSLEPFRPWEWTRGSFLELGKFV